MLPCPFCNSELPERALYCPHCGKQAKCKECRDVLVSEARFCLSCGTAVGEGNITQASSEIVKSPSEACNTIELDENKQGRRLRVAMTDEAIGLAAEPLIYLLTPRAPGQTTKPKQVVVEDVEEAQLILPGTKYQTDTGSENNEDTSDASLKALPPNADFEALNRIFRKGTDGKPKLDDSRLKPKNKTDFIERVCVLFIYAHELGGISTVSRAELNKFLDDCTLHNSTARAWLAKTPLLSWEGDSASLSKPGRDKAKDFVRDYLDPKVEAGWTYARGKTRSRARSANDEDEGQESAKSPKGARSKGLASVVGKLLADGYFNEYRTGKQTLAELEKRGHHFALNRVTDTLTRLLKKDSLLREKRAGEWAYKKK